MGMDIMREMKDEVCNLPLPDTVIGSIWTLLKHEFVYVGLL